MNWALKKIARFKNYILSEVNFKKKITINIRVRNINWVNTVMIINTHILSIFEFWVIWIIWSTYMNHSILWCFTNLLSLQFEWYVKQDLSRDSFFFLFIGKFKQLLISEAEMFFFYCQTKKLPILSFLYRIYL